MARRSLYLGLLAGVHCVAGASLVAAAHTLVDGVLPPLLPPLARPGSVRGPRGAILIAAMVALLALLSLWAPGLQAMLGALALPGGRRNSFPPLLALLWFPRLTAPAVVAAR